jgi:hypothetical protein
MTVSFEVSRPKFKGREQISVFGAPSDFGLRLSKFAL